MTTSPDYGLPPPDHAEFIAEIARQGQEITRLRVALAERDREWHAALVELPDQMAEAWGRDAAWVTTGSKVSALVHEWLSSVFPPAVTEGGAA